MTVRKKLQNFLRVVADCRKFDALLLESLNGTLQLDQLPFAERSPVGGTEEEKYRAVSPFQ
jgi:hypothetical protein